MTNNTTTAAGEGIINGTALEPYTGGGADLVGVAVDQLVGSVGEPLFALLVAGAVWLSLWYAGDGDIATPSIVTILLGAWIVPILPGNYQQTAFTIVIVGVGAGAFAVYQRYFMNPGVT